MACWKLLAGLLIQVAVITMVFFAYFQTVLKPPSAFHVSTRPPAMYESGWHSPSKRVRLGDGSSALTVLLWTWPFGELQHLEKCSKLLKVPDCHFTTNRAWYLRADAVIIHHRGVCGGPQLLPQGPRPRRQWWIWLNVESPSHSPNLTSMDNLFNLTMTYRRDSDIFLPYGRLRVLAKREKLAIPPRKSKMVAWVVSHWDPDSRQVKYFQELRKFLPVDLYGLNRTLPAHKGLSILSKYRFYLAFEDSIHEDYITEQLWRNALTSQSVPIVLGPPRKNYERYLPPGAFIHVDDFKTTRELACFLYKLYKSRIQYLRYFKWRRWLEPILETSWSLRFCKACRALQEKAATFQRVPELSQWFK